MTPRTRSQPRGWSGNALLFSFWLFAAGWIVACSDAPEPVSSAVTTDSAGVTIASSNPRSVPDTCAVDASPLISIGTASGTPAYMLDRVFGAVTMSDGRIALANDGTKDLRFFDPQGRHLMTAGREGDGPGEFRSPFYLFVLPGDTIWVGDYRPWRFQVYAPNGSWVRTIEPTPEYPNPPDAFGVMEDGRSVLAQGDFLGTGGDFRLDSVVVRVHSPTGGLLTTIGKFPNGRWGQVEGGAVNFWTYPIFESFTRIAVGKRHVAISSSTEPEVRLVDADGKLRTVIRWETDDRTVTPAHVDAYRQMETNRAAAMDSARRSRYLVTQISEKRPHAEKFGAVGQLLFGTDGKLWVRVPGRPPEPRSLNWLAFEPAGEFVCHLRQPADVEVYEFGADYLLGLHQDSLGVERVVKHALR